MRLVNRPAEIVAAVAMVPISAIVNHLWGCVCSGRGVYTNNSTRVYKGVLLGHIYPLIDSFFSAFLLGISALPKL